MDTIVAIATASGIGSIAVVKLSGKRAYEIALLLSKKSSLTPRMATLSHLYNHENEVIDEAILIYFKAPYSYTTEDIVEFQCHGGSVIANMIVKEILKHGARVANPGEFTKRAFLNGRIDLTKAEAIGQLIEAKSESAAKMLSRHLKGELKDFVESARDDLIEIMAHVEVVIDYAEEDLPKNIEDITKEKLNSLIEALKKILIASKQREGLMNGFKVAIIGKPNVGKSSLLNKLLQYDRAIISDIAGTTRDTIEEEIRVGTHLVKFVDTAGIREASDEIEKIGISRSLEAIKSADIVIAMFDNSRVFDKQDEAILELIKDYEEDKKIIYILNKSDLTKKFNKTLSQDMILLSCKNDTSLLILRLEELLDNNLSHDEIVLSSTRQISAVENTLNSLITSQELINEGELELFSFNLNEAITSLSSITRAFDRTEILDSMFSKFCLGK
ncbi:MAG: tRNA uridine-5-carboxymethylaminomethyl(34) synthesis GTPase MnmE [Campylobacteraceae bacterium]